MRAQRPISITLQTKVDILTLKKLDKLFEIALERLWTYTPAHHAYIGQVGNTNKFDMTILDDNQKLIHRFEITLKNEGTKAEVVHVPLRG